MSLSGYWKEREGRTRRDGGSRRAQMCPSPGMLMPTRYLLVAGLRGYCDTSPKRVREYNLLGCRERGRGKLV
jgi:hypothetical protein